MTQSSAGTGARPDLAILNEMVGMRKGLQALVSKGVVPTKETVLALMTAEKAVYAQDGNFAIKDQALGRLIAVFEEGGIDVADILKAVGIDASGVKPKVGFLKRIFGR